MQRSSLATAAAAAAFLVIAGCSAESPAEVAGRGMVSNEARRAAAPPTVTPQASGTTQGLIAVSPVSARVVWVAGRGGTFARTTDGGDHWHAGTVPGAEGLQFRDVEGVSERVAYLLSIGTGNDSRIYKTTDGGASWAVQFTNQDPDAFYDGFSFWSPRRGLAFSDSVNGRFPMRRTTDGATWVDIGDRLPAALPGESGFASSGTLIATQGAKNAWVGTGGASRARILATRDGGDSWAAYDTPLRGSPSAGIFSVAFRDGRHGVLGGGDLDPGAPPFSNLARSSDGGRTWQLGATAPVGTIFGLAYARERDDDDEDDGGRRARVVVTGPGGSAYSSDEGDSWTAFAGVTGFWAVAFADERSGWLVGTGGRILKITFADD